MNNHAELRAALEAGPTPGPWTMDGTGTRALARGADLTIVAVRHRLSGQAHEANARLIAAANPEAIRALLDERDALREALTECLHVNETDAGDDVAVWANAMLVARAALAQGERHETV